MTTSANIAITRLALIRCDGRWYLSLGIAGTRLSYVFEERSWPTRAEAIPHFRRARDRLRDPKHSGAIVAVARDLLRETVQAAGGKAGEETT